MMLLPAVIALLQQPARPQRTVADPGVVVSAQRVSPAGLQTVFPGRVAGVRFAKSSDEMWVAVPNSLYRLRWQADTVLARVAIQGQPGVHGIAIDTITGRPLVSFVSRTPNAVGRGQPRPRPLTMLHVVDADAVGDSVAPRSNSGAIGDYMGGAPAVAARADSGVPRLAVVPLPANDQLAIVNAANGAPTRFVSLGVEPIAAVLSTDGHTAYVSVLGGPKPTATERAARQCCDPRSEAVRVDA